MPDAALDNLLPPRQVSEQMREYLNLTAEQNLERADMANPAELNRIIWFSVRGAQREMPAVASLPAFELLRNGIREDDDEHEAEDEDEDED